jgi:hypothetical protein
MRSSFAQFFLHALGLIFSIGVAQISDAKEDSEISIRCVATLRELFEASSSRVDSMGAALPEGRKPGNEYLSTQKTQFRREKIGILGSLSIRKEYFETTTAKVRGREIVTYKIKNKSSLRDELIEVVTDIRKL